MTMESIRKKLDKPCFYAGGLSDGHIAVIVVVVIVALAVLIFNVIAVVYVVYKTKNSSHTE